MGKFIDLTGQKFGRLTVIKRGKNTKYNKATFLCKCDCGNTKVVIGSSLTNGRTTSCGCKQVEDTIKRSTTHGKCYTRLHSIWNGMKTRCYNKNRECYKNYGALGIKVCEEWKSDFQAFYDWSMSHGYNDNLTIDRINPYGNYEPSNCRWATRHEQNNNQRNSECNRKYKEEYLKRTSHKET